MICCSRRPSDYQLVSTVSNRGNEVRPQCSKGIQKALLFQGFQCCPPKFCRGVWWKLVGGYNKSSSDFTVSPLNGEVLYERVWRKGFLGKKKNLLNHWSSPFCFLQPLGMTAMLLYFARLLPITTHSWGPELEGRSEADQQHYCKSKFCSNQLPLFC